MVNRLFAIILSLFVIISCLTIGVSAATSSDPSLDYWTTVFENIKICTYYEYGLDGYPPGEPNFDMNLNRPKPITMSSYNTDDGYIAEIYPQIVDDLDFYDSNYRVDPYNASYYIDIPFNLKSGNLSFQLEYRGENATNMYEDLNGNKTFFTSFRDMLLSSSTVLTAYSYNSKGDYTVLSDGEFYYTANIDDNDSWYSLNFDIQNITDLSYIKLVVKTTTQLSMQVGGTMQNITGRIPLYHTLKLNPDNIYIPPSYEDMVLSGIQDVSNKLDQMLFPSTQVENDVNDLKQDLNKTEQNVNDMISGVDLEEPKPFDEVMESVTPYFNLLDFDIVNQTIGRFWKADVVMRLLMMVGFFGYMSFILFGKKA